MDSNNFDSIYNTKVNPLIKKSWIRSSVYGVEPDKTGIIVKYTEEELQNTLDEYNEIIDIINSYANILLMNTLEDNHLVINLFDRHCHLLHQWGKKDCSLKLSKVGLAVGISWKNKFMGTNGPGEAYLLDKTIIIEGYEQYLYNRKNLVQISIPIHDSIGNLCCIIDITMPNKQNALYYYNSLLMISNGVERELRRMKFIDTRCIKSQYKKSVEDIAFVNEKFIEITQRYLNRQVLYDATFNQNYVGTALYSKSGKIIIDANDKYKDIVEGIAGTRDIIGKNIEELYEENWQGKDKIDNFWIDRSKNKNKGELHEAVIPKGGKLHYYNISVEPIKKHENILGWVETISEITKIKEAQQEINARDQLFTEILDRFQLPVTILNYPDLKVKYMNEYGRNLMCKINGYNITAKNIVNKSFYELSKASGDKLALNMLERHEKENFMDAEHINVELASGTSRSLKLSEIPIYDNIGHIDKLVVAGVDITEELKFLKAKDQFFSIISHELRSPANIIIAASQLLLTDKYREELNDNSISHIEKIRINSYRLLRLINNFLDIQKSEAGYLDINMGNFDLVSFSEEITNSITHLTDSKGIEVIFDTEFEEKIIAMDIEKYERILLNLLSNATKFTPEGGNILVNIFSKENRICVSVKDTGIGIDEDKLEKIFDKFTIVDSSLSRMSEGTGLGLNLVKILIEKMNGRIIVKSKVGKGTEFIICIPDETLDNKDISIIKRSRKEIDHVTNIEFSDVT